MTDRRLVLPASALGDTVAELSRAASIRAVRQTWQAPVQPGIVTYDAEDVVAPQTYSTPGFPVLSDPVAELVVPPGRWVLQMQVDQQLRLAGPGFTFAEIGTSFQIDGTERQRYRFPFQADENSFYGETHRWMTTVTGDDERTATIRVWAGYDSDDDTPTERLGTAAIVAFPG